jgi:DNA-directed RNA polymerase subunit M/transcription elongation factor TFIIS
MALNIERGIFNYALGLYSKKRLNETWNDVFKFIYVNRCVIIYDNLNPKGRIQNTGLLEKLLSKEFGEFELCKLSPQEIFPERHKYLLETHCPDMFRDVPKPLERPDGLFKCGKCKSYKTEYAERQTRSADEPTTKFCYYNRCQVKTTKDFNEYSTNVLKIQIRTKTVRFHVKNKKLKIYNEESIVLRLI